MWARVVEVMLGLWLVISPFIFGHFPENRPLWLSDVLAGALAASIALASSIALATPYRRLRYLHLLNIGVAFWLIAHGYVAGGQASAPGYRNEILTGLVLLLFAVIPVEANDPPESWRRFYTRRAAAR